MTSNKKITDLDLSSYENIKEHQQPSSTLYMHSDEVTKSSLNLLANVGSVSTDKLSTDIEQVSPKEYEQTSTMVLIPPDIPPPTVGFASGYINLLKTIMGAGLLALPSAFSLVGIVPGSTILLLASLMSVFGLYLLVLSINIAGRGATFATLAILSYPKIAILFESVIVIKSIGVGVTYMGIATKQISKILQHLAGDSLWLPLQGSRIWVFLITAAVTPMIAMPRIDSLKYTSFLGLLSILYMTCLAVAMATVLKGTFPTNPDTQPYSWFAPFQLGSPRCLSTFIFALTCHQSIPSIQSEAINSTTQGMMAVCFSSIATSLIVYFVFGLTSYVVWGSKINSPIIQDYPNSGAQYLVARFLYAFLMIFSIPLLTYPGRNSAIRLVELCAPRVARQYSRFLYLAVTSAIIVVILGISALEPQMDAVIGYLGGTTGPIICFILPGIIYHRLATIRNGDGIQKQVWVKRSALVLAGAGTVVMCLLLLTQILVSFKVIPSS